ncbi:type IV toxin-antitoxin system AbiEi family antitoxin domain-containing protein [Leucobacter sp. W1153]|uniref:type IV toxin-antitoxin system AbiEi family antitoxin domain-containing protein n=1 Tax=Leucobacter sp. W1153 TaxID=3439064 RepID=UPI003F3DCDE5
MAVSYRRDLWEIAVSRQGVVTVAAAQEAGVPAVEVRKLAARGALWGEGHGVYIHQDFPPSPLTQPAVAVALGGNEAFLQRESVCNLLGLGQFNPKKIRVGTRRRVRRELPQWVDLERRTGLTENDITSYEGIAATTIERTLRDLKDRMPFERWIDLVDQALRRDLLDAHEANALRQGRT